MRCPPKPSVSKMAADDASASSISSGSMLGAFLGTILIATLEQSLLRWDIISEFWRDALLGLLILLAVAADAVILDRIRSLWARTSMRSLSERELPEGGAHGA